MANFLSDVHTSSVRDFFRQRVGQTVLTSDIAEEFGITGSWYDMRQLRSRLAKMSKEGELVKEGIDRCRNDGNIREK